MFGEDVGGMSMPGIELEPLDPFLEDVFAGLDDHPPGLWHPTFLEASAQQHASGIATGTEAGDFNMGINQRMDEQMIMPAGPNLGTSESDSLQLQTAEQQPQAQHLLQRDGHPSPVQLQQHQEGILHSESLIENTEDDTQTVNCHVLQSACYMAEVLNLQCSQSSSTLSPVATADELTASSNSLGLEAGAALAAHCITGDVLLHSSANMQPQMIDALNSGSSDAVTVSRSIIDGSKSVADRTAATSDCDVSTAADGACSSTKAAEPESPHSSTPDIDDVPEEQQQAPCGTHVAAGQSPPSQPSPTAMPMQAEGEQLGQEQWTVDCAGGPQLEAGPTAAISQHFELDHLLQEQQHERVPKQPQEQGEKHLKQVDVRPSGSSPADHVSEGVQDIPAASTSCHSAAVDIPSDVVHTPLTSGPTTRAATATAESSVQCAGQPAKADDAEATDSGEFVSPSTSWHSCMTQASHAASSFAISAVSLATARGPSAPSVAARLAEQQPTQLQQQQLQQHLSLASTAGGKGSTAVVAVHPAVCPAGVPAAPISDTSHRSAAAEGKGCPAGAPAEAADQHHGWCGPCRKPPPAAHQQAEQPVSEPTTQQQQLQQQWQQELWQDVSPPSLGSSPPTPSGYTTVHPMHMHEVTAAATGTTASASAEAPAQSAAATPDTDETVEREGHGRYYLDEPSIQLRAPAAAAAAAAGGARPHLSSARPGLYPGNTHIANSSYMLRQSELVDLSLSTSVHPSQQQHQFSPGWLTAHQQLPPAAAQAVERAVCDLNDSYFFHERLGHSQSRMHQQGPTAPGAHAVQGAHPSDGSGKPPDVPQASSGVAAANLGASGLLGPELIRRSAAGGNGLWSHASTQPQQDQQARHRLPSHSTQQSGWARPGVLGQWFSNTVQQPLAAAASLAAAGVGHRLASAGLKSAGSAGVGLTGAAAASRVAPVDEPGGVGSDVELHDAVLVEHTPDLPQSLQEQEDTSFQGLLFLGGQDSHGRPVVIINTDAVPAGHNSAPRDAALTYLLKKLTPVVSRGPYVLVLVAFHHGSRFRLLPAVWCVRAYHSLPRAFRKHVKHVVLLQPSLMVRAGLALLYPFISSKAHTKIKQVHRLLDIEPATSGEVQVPHLGEDFLTTVQQFSRAQHQGTARHSADGSSMTVPVPGALRS